MTNKQGQKRGEGDVKNWKFWANVIFECPQAAKQLSEFNPLSLSNNKSYRLKKRGVF